MSLFCQGVFATVLVFSSLNLAQPNIIDGQESMMHIKSQDDSPVWDLLIFTQQWPPTVCKEWKEHNAKHSCSMPTEEDSWTVHGLWPTQFHTIGPAFCNRTWHFDPEAIKPIEPSLMQYWTNIEAGTPLYSFWAHEWNKHGTCAAILEPLNSELKYFSKGLDFLGIYSMLDILREADIVPSDTKEYSVIDINNAIKVRLGINPAIECRKIDGKSFLVEIRICFDKALKLANCDGIIGHYNFVVVDDTKIVTNCKETEGVIYPENLNFSDDDNKYIVQLYKLTNWLQWLTL